MKQMRVYRAVAAAIIMFASSMSALSAYAEPVSHTLRININVAEMARLSLGGDVLLQGSLAVDPQETDPPLTGTTSLHAIANFDYQLAIHWDPMGSVWEADLSRSYRGDSESGPGYLGSLAGTYDALEQVDGQVVVEALPASAPQATPYIPESDEAASANVYYGIGEDQVLAGVVTVTLMAR